MKYNNTNQTTELDRELSSSEAPSILAIVREVGILSQKLTSLIETELPSEIKLTQFGILNHLRVNSDEWSLSRLSSAFQISNGAMTNNINRLQKLGLVQTFPDAKDSRTKYVAITDHGRSTVVVLNTKIERTISKLMSEITADEVNALLFQLQAFRHKLDA